MKVRLNSVLARAEKIRLKYKSVAERWKLWQKLIPTAAFSFIVKAKNGKKVL